jgi:hypothetical protein
VDWAIDFLTDLEVFYSKFSVTVLCKINRPVLERREEHVTVFYDVPQYYWRCNHPAPNSTGGATKIIPHSFPNGAYVYMATNKIEVMNNLPFIPGPKKSNIL